MSRLNEFGQPIGDALPDGWTPPPLPSRMTLAGRVVKIVPMDAEAHGAALYEAFKLDETDAGWTYMANGPYSCLADFMTWLKTAAVATDPMLFSFLNAQSGQPVGYGALMRIDARMACIEVGNLRMSPLQQRTPMSTEAIHLLADYAFKLGYRRFEWKCDSLNAPSRTAAERLGFTYEGTFRNAMHYKGRSRDTAWFSITEDEWPAIREAQQAWLAPDNFDQNGIQKQRLAELIQQARG
ncbi:GNAT family N-acetyltransferase [Marinobacterium lutimaris]|uniref:Protein N-acetyltransferase, RimJ/RimL family n=1 Tax=Marinobacterium lutimaris TaxID=568106 RepID=A0A1H5Y4W3_9GAMM|nr:GNAT family protein [Marinobacterium lutimaris]SEG18576.1 Protein N-acetyltransferase, RimJ/RimL family [Marinobacterium lutimaris]